MMPPVELLSRKVLSGICCAPGAIAFTQWIRRRSFCIVMYHGVTSDTMPVASWCQLHPSEFANQIDYLDREYKVLPLSEIVQRLWDGKTIPDRAVAITFDDGFRNVYSTAFPILRRYHAPATVFLVTSVIGTRQPAWPDLLHHDIASTRCECLELDGRAFSLRTKSQRTRVSSILRQMLKALPDDERQHRFQELRSKLGPLNVDTNSPHATLNWEEIEELSRTGLFDFGAHTHSHPILSRCPVEKQYEEIKLARDILRDRLGRCDLFAYPNGQTEDFTTETKRILKELGFRCGLSTQPGLNQTGTDPFALRRVGVGHDTIGI